MAAVAINYTQYQSIKAQRPKKSLQTITKWVTKGRVPNTENPRKSEDLEGC